MMTERAEMVGALAEALQIAARASVGRGAQYAQGEPINLDTESLWRGVADGLVRLIEKVVDERLGKRDVERS